MRETLLNFTQQPLFDAASDFLGELGIKHGEYDTKEALPLSDYFDDNMPQYLQDANATIDRLYDLGCVNDASLGGVSPVENPKYEAMNIFAFDAKPEARITRTIVSSLTRAFNRIADDPVILIIRQGNYMTLATCDREKGAKAEIMGKVTILRNIDCSNPHPGHIQILSRIAKEVNGCSDFDTLYKKWLYSFSMKLLSDDFFNGYKAIYEDIIALITGKRMKKESGKWRETIDEEIPVEEKSEYGNKVMESFQSIDSVIDASKKEVLNQETGEKEFVVESVKLREKAEKAVRDYVKKLMGRLVFIQFLQKKGWMGVPEDNAWGEGDREFLQNVFMQSQHKNDFVDAVLEPLFRDINTDRAGFLVRSNEVSFGNRIKVPYLNGGLFEEDAYDRAAFAIPAKYFWNEDATINTRDKDLGLLRFFAKYNFTIDENAPDDVEVGVDPEMLGRIFENLLEDNKDKGAFYTPKEIVQYMCRESLIAYLTNYSIEHGNTNPYEKVEPFVRKIVLDPENIVPRMKAEKPEALKSFGDALRNVKICDPAIGSGAFPMGLLNELVRCRIAIGAWAKDADGNVLVGNRAALKCEIVCNNIYGVDIERGAIDIARLRFWLSIVVDEKNPQTLPNLDYKFMQGDSLITTFDGEYVNLDTNSQQHSHVPEMRKIKVELHKLKLEYYNATGDHKHELDIKIKDTILRLISLQIGYESWKWIEDHTNRQLSMFPEAEPPRQLSFADIKQDLPEEIQRICNLGVELRKQLKDINKSLTERSQIDIRFFDWRMMFTEVFEGDNPGFDIVIGNPPYGVSIKGDYRNAIVNTLGKVPDYEIYYYFSVLSFYLLKSEGILSYIVPNTWLFNTYAKAYRENLFNTWELLEILDCSKFKIFESATVMNSIYCFKKTDSPRDRVGYRNTSAAESFQDLISEPHESITKKDLLEMNQNWGLAFRLSKQCITLINKITNKGKKLSEYFPEVSQGLIAYDKYRGQSADIIENRAYHYSEYHEGLKKMLWGEDVTRYSLNWNGNEWIDYCDGIANPRQPKYFVGKRLLVREITNPSIFATITNEEYYNDPAIIIVLDNNKYSLECVLAIINSKLATFYHFNHSPKATKGSFPKILVQDIQDFPLPNVSEDMKRSLTEKANMILQTKESDIMADISTLDNQIDRLVYELYGLTNGEVKIIDPHETTVGSDDDLFKA